MSREPNGPLKRPRGRPAGSRNKPKDTAELLERLAELAPVKTAVLQNKTWNKQQIRLQPEAYDQERQRLLKLILEKRPEFAQYIFEHPNEYTVERLESKLCVYEELNCIIRGVELAAAEGRKFAYGHLPDDFRHCQHPHHQYDPTIQHHKQEEP